MTRGPRPCKLPPATPSNQSVVTALRTRLRLSAVGMLLPALVVVVGLGLYPIGQSIYLGLTNYRVGGSFGLAPIRFVGLLNFQRLLEDEQFRAGLLLIVGVAFVVVFVTYFLAYLLAALLNQRFPLRRVVRTIVLLPIAMPPLIAGEVWRYLYDPNVGVVNQLLIDLHLETTARYLPLDPTAGVFWIAVVGIWLALPFATLLLLAAIQGVNPDLLEAAAIDGAGPIRRFMHVTFPATRNVLAAILPLSFAGQILAFDVYFALSGSGATGRAGFLMPTMYAFFQLTSGLLGRAAAVGDVLLVVALLAFVISRAISTKDAV